ncbi:hypothetical protein [Dictyobacter aurantiacus]|uniref:Uncharacterized protein n=1 Tax=Dictyobacter aurantiacus TaxID=1936993 RepID=A0A401ZR27_9CHLR|nr:hypothetical protein [Dictyobacter aurantiacus]GCE09368.1 hypothetical protein KDAU_66970 [Dictyobacter aurantiacus]
MSSYQSLQAEYQQHEQRLLQDLDQLVTLLDKESEDRLARVFASYLQDLQEMVTQHRPRSEKASVAVSLQQLLQGGYGSPMDRVFSDQIRSLFGRIFDHCWIYREARFQGVD